MDSAGARIRRARPHRRHHRTRQLHRPARRHRRGARHRARRRQAGGRPDHARRLCRALHRRRRHAAGGRRRSMRGTSMSICRCSGRAAARWSRRGSRRCARRCARRRPARRAWSAPRRRCWRRPGRPASARRAWSTQRRAPDIDWVARLGAAAAETGVAAEAALSARARRPAAGRRAAGAPMMGLLASLFARGEPVLSEASEPRRRGDRRAACRLVPARLERAGSRAPADRPQRHRASRHAGDASSPASSCRGWPRTRRKSSRSRSRARGAAAGWRAGCSTLHLRRLAGLGARAVFLEVDEDNTAGAPALRARRFPRGRPPPQLLPQAPAASRPPRWCCAAIWFEREPRNML